MESWGPPKTMLPAAEPPAEGPRPAGGPRAGMPGQVTVGCVMPAHRSAQNWPSYSISGRPNMTLTAAEGRLGPWMGHGSAAVECGLWPDGSPAAEELAGSRGQNAGGLEEGRCCCLTLLDRKLLESFLHSGPIWSKLPVMGHRVQHWSWLVVMWEHSNVLFGMARLAR